MALRTVKIAIDQARAVERLAPSAWLINFTNPAGLITQAIRHHTGVRVVGICDTPTEMLHRIQTALGAAAEEVSCDYVGLNHLGWVRRIELRGEDITRRCLADDVFLDRLYSAPLFDHDLIRTLGLIPTEYLFFYYSRRRALENQRRSGSTRGAEIAQLNTALLATLRSQLASGNGAGAMKTYVNYLNTRSGSYMKLEGSGSSALGSQARPEEDPFRAATGYHRIALDVMEALTGARPACLIVNTRNGVSIPDLEPEAVVEVSSDITTDSITPRFRRLFVASCFQSKRTRAPRSRPQSRIQRSWLARPCSSTLPLANGNLHESSSPTCVLNSISNAAISCCLQPNKNRRRVSEIPPARVASTSIRRDRANSRAPPGS